MRHESDIDATAHLRRRAMQIEVIAAPYFFSGSEPLPGLLNVNELNIVLA